MDSLLQKEKHKRYLKMMLNALPSPFAYVDMSRMAFVYFTISGLDLLDSLHELSEDQRRHAIEWIYRVQLSGAGGRSGFQPSTTLPVDSMYRCGHLASTYTGLATLLILGDDLSRVDKKSIIEGVKACQTENGSFICAIGCENDMRFIYCACCISYILNDWSGVDKRRAIDYILNSINYDGGLGQGPGFESHGGSTFCAIASLYLMNELENVLTNKELDNLQRWLVMRQDYGFNGRPGKPADTCYSYWVGATLKLLGIISFTDYDKNMMFVLSTQDNIIGGFSKYKNTQTDPLHTYLGLCGLSILGDTTGDKCLLPLHAALNITQRAYAHLRSLHDKWTAE